MASDQQSHTNGGSSADSISDLANAIVQAMHQPKRLTPGAQSVELTFRLIRNGLGDFGGHGDTAGDRALIRIDQISEGNDRSELRFRDPLPRSARSALVHHVDERPDQLVPVDSMQHRIQVDGTRFAYVEILDELRTAVAAGVPVRVSAVVPVGTKPPVSAK